MDIHTWFYTFVVLIFLPPQTYQSQSFDNSKFREKKYSELVPTRLLEIMRSYYEDSTDRMYAMNKIKFTYEEAPHYEQGFVIGEIIERYKKMVEHVKRPMEFKSDTVFDTLKRTELIQKLYFEAYHLCNMMHEIQRKYRYMPEFADLSQVSDHKEAARALAWLKVLEKQRKAEKKANQKKYKKMRALYLKLGKLQNYAPPNKTYNKWWPIDYGWEIDYYW